MNTRLAPLLCKNKARTLANGIGVNLQKRAFSLGPPSRAQRLVILGSGWGGFEVLRGIDKNRWDVTIVSADSYFNFTPLLASCAVGTLEFRTALEPVRRYASKARVYQAWCDDIDFKQKTLKCVPATPPIVSDGSRTTQDPFELKYDKLVIAVGAYSQTFNIPGVKENAHFLKDIKDARRIRQRIMECFEQASQPVVTDIERRNLLTFCIVGGGPTGVEFAAELHDLLATDIARHFPHLARLARIHLYDVASEILGMFDEKLRKYAENKFSRSGIQIKTGHHVERVSPGSMFVKEQGEIPFGLLVWSTGLAPNPLVQSITERAKDQKSGSLYTNDNLNVLCDDGASGSETPDPDVWAIGDAAVIKGMPPLPATAQVASQKAKYLVKKLNRIVKEKDSPNPFEFHNQGSLAYLGDWKAVYDRSHAETAKTQNAGRLAWLLWRSAYFTRTVSIRNKILVPVYWFMNWIFGRDLSRF